MSSYSASNAHAKHGGATTTCTYPGNGYGTPSPLDFRSSKGCAGSPTMTDTGRLVLNGHRSTSGLDTGSLRAPSSGARGRSPSHSYTGNYSTSFGSAGEALSHSASEHAHASNKGVSNGANPSNDAMETGPADVKPQTSSSMRFSSTVPTHSMGSMDAAARQHGLTGNRKRESDQKTSPSQLSAPTSSESGAAADAEHDYKDLHGSYQSNQLLHKCESCSKVYRHPSCLVKHRWEHTMYWKEASKFLMSKHQQVQLLEAAAILVGMDSNARSLPEEKALWPAAVSPPSSGLLGCDQVNFDKLMASKTRNLATGNDAPTAPFGTSAPPAHATPMMVSPSAPMDDDLEDDDPGAHDDSSELELQSREDAYGLHSGGDVMADMDMETEE